MLGNRFLLALLILGAPAAPRVHGQSHFTSCLNGTGNVFNATVIVPVESTPNVSGVPLAPGSEIAVFSSDPQYPDLCVGLITWQGSHSFINVWGDDDMTPGRDGLLAGEVMDYRVWDRATDTEYAGSSVNVSYTLGDGLYDNDGVYVLGDLSASMSVNDGTDSSNVGQKTVIVIPVDVTRFVAITGNDAGNDCTDHANPCATIAHAVSQAINGDILVVASGTYIEPDLVIDKALNIQGQGVIVR